MHRRGLALTLATAILVVVGLAVAVYGPMPAHGGVQPLACALTHPGELAGFPFRIGLVAYGVSQARAMAPSLLFYGIGGCLLATAIGSRLLYGRSRGDGGVQ